MEPCFTLSLSKKKHTQLSKIWTKGIILTDFVLLVMKSSALILVLPVTEGRIVIFVPQMCGIFKQREDKI